MRNVVGQTPRGKDFFPRNTILNTIYRRLEAGAHIFLAAPRRVGKTSIMRNLGDNPREKYHFIYIITESVHDPEEYYQKLLESVLKSEAVGRLAKSKESIKTLVRDIASNISIKIPWLEVTINNEEERESFQTSFEKLLDKLETADETIVIMVDEFPQTVENIKDKHGTETAERFLRMNREQRQRASPNLRFIYTGSIGLPAVVKKLASTSVINDLNVVEIPPLSEKEAARLTELLLSTYQVSYENTVIPYLLEKIQWLIPFHIQLAVQELIDVFETKGSTLEKEDVDRAFSQLLNLRNDIYFEHYYSRLKEAFPTDQYRFALAVLNQAAMQNTMNQEEIRVLASTHKILDNYEAVLESLVYDGYLHFNIQESAYHFNSNLLQKWWKKKNPLS